MIGSVERALSELRKGRPVLLYDSADRENEVDMVIYAGVVETRHIVMLRKDAGGLICYATLEDIGRRLGLVFAEELLRAHSLLSQLAGKRLRYGDPPAFSLWVNHVSVSTGIRDADRAKTVRELHEVVRMACDGLIEKAREKFLREFVSPGHVPILLARSLSTRRGHTEASVVLAKLAGLYPSVVLAEMLDDSGNALPLDKAIEYAKRNGLVLVTIDEVVSYADRSS